MTDPLHDLTDAHLQSALDASCDPMPCQPSDIRHSPVRWPSILAHARQIAANEKLAAELAELRAKYEPKPVDPVDVEVAAMMKPLVGNSYTPDFIAPMLSKAIRRGMEMQPDPFTRDEAVKIVGKITAAKTPHDYMAPAIRALTTPPAELRAMLGEG